MASTVADLIIKMTADTASLQADLKRAQGQVSGAMKGIEDSVNFAKKALAALGITVGAAAFVNLIKGSIDAADKLADLSKVTGVSASQLSAFAAVGRQTGTSAETIAGHLTKMAKNMTDVEKPSSQAGQALKALGLNAEEFKKLSPDQKLLEVAKAADRFADGGGKAAAVEAVMGKGAAELIPFMQDLARTQKLNAEVTDEQAEAANLFNDNLSDLKTSGMAWSRELAVGMVPALANASTAVLDVVNGTGGLRDQIKKLAADGTITEWTTRAVKGLTYVVDGVIYVKRFIQDLGNMLGATAAATAAFFASAADATTKAISGDFKGAWNALKGGISEANRIQEDYEATSKAIWGSPTIGQKIRERMEQQKGLTQAVQETTKAQVPYGDETDKSTDKTRRLAEATKGLVEIVVYRKRMSEEGLKAIAQTETALGKETDKIREQIEAQRKAIEQAGMSREQTAALEVVRLRDAAATALQSAAMQAQLPLHEGIAAELQQQAAAWYELADLKEQGIHVEAAKEAQAAWAKTTEAVFSGLTDALFRAFEEGKGFMQAFRDTLENAFKTLILRPTIEAIMRPVAGAMGGIVSGARAGLGGIIPVGGGAGGGGGSGMLGNIGTMVGLGGSMLGAGLGYGLAAYGASATIGGTLAGAGAMISGGLAGGMAGLGSVIAGVGAIAGVLGPIALGVALLVKGFTRGPKKITEEGISGQIVGGDIAAEAYAKWKQSGSWFVGGRKGTKYSDLGEEASLALEQTTAAIFGGMAEYSKALGLPVELLSQVNYEFKAAKGKTEEETQKNLEAAFEGYRQALAARFADVLEPFRNAGETLAETMERLVGIQQMSESLNQFGGIFSRIATLSVEAREELIGFAGGIEALVQKAQAFVGAYYSEGEQAGIAARPILQALEALGIGQAGDYSTKAEFRALIESMDVSTTEGRRALNTLLDLAPAFAGVADYLAKNGGTLGELAGSAPQGAVLEAMFAESQAATIYAEQTAAGVAAVETAVTASGDNIVAAIEAMRIELSGLRDTVKDSMARTSRDIVGAIEASP